MAITFEEENQKIDWPAVVGILVIIALILTAIVYLFFISPQKVEVLIPSKLQEISEISKVNLDVNRLVTDESFKALKSFIVFNIPPSENIGKANLFQP